MGQHFFRHTVSWVSFVRFEFFSPNFLTKMFKKKLSGPRPPPGKFLHTRLLTKQCLYLNKYFHQDLYRTPLLYRKELKLDTDEQKPTFADILDRISVNIGCRPTQKKISFPDKIYLVSLNRTAISFPIYRTYLRKRPI